MTGKEKCRLLRDVRRRIADENEISISMPDCTHEGPCAGTCPRCEQEVRILESALENRKRLGKRIALAGLCAGMVVANTGCSVIDTLSPGTLSGDVVALAPTVEPTPDLPVLLGEIISEDVENAYCEPVAETPVPEMLLGALLPEGVETADGVVRPTAEPTPAPANPPAPDGIEVTIDASPAVVTDDPGF